MKSGAEISREKKNHANSGICSKIEHVDLLEDILLCQYQCNSHVLFLDGETLILITSMAFNLHGERINAKIFTASTYLPWGPVHVVSFYL